MVQSSTLVPNVVKVARWSPMWFSVETTELHYFCRGRSFLTQSNLLHKDSLPTIRPVFRSGLTAMEGRHMFVGRLSLAGTVGGRCELRAIKAARHAPLGLAALLILVVGGGCRTPWRTASSEPNFDRLIEIEQQSEPYGAGRGPRASRLRPGQSQDPANHTTSDGGQGLVPPAAANELSSGRGDSSRTRNANRDASHTSDMEEMLVDVPPAQRELLRREMSAMQARNHAEDADDQNPSPRAMEKSPAGTRTVSAHRRISDDIQEADFVQTKGEAAARSEAQDDTEFEQDGYTDTSKYQLAARKSNPQPRGASAKPKGVDEPYTRKLSDQAPARSDSTIDVADRTAPTADVVAASYARADQPANSTHLSNEELDAETNADALDWRQHIAAAMSQLEQQAASVGPEEQVHRQMVDRLLHLSLGDIEAASEPIDGLQTNGQDFIRHSLKSLYEVTNPTGNPVEIKRYTLAMLSQRQALSHLAAVSNLEVRNATFCTEVDGFGVVSKFPQYAFKPDQELLLYCELDNFVSTHTDGKGYETQLQGSYEIVDSGGRRIADQVLPMDSHLCKNQRRDYFIAYRIYMPQKIELGKYQLKLTVEDMKGRKFGQATLDFQIQ